MSASITVVNSGVSVSVSPTGVDLTVSNPAVTLLVGSVSSIVAGSGLTGGTITTTGTVAVDFAPNGGGTSGQVPRATDSRLSNARTPTAHGSSHNALTGSDPVQIEITQVNNLPLTLSGKLDNTVLLSTGAGLLGGGFVAGNLTLSVDFATSGGGTVNQAVRATDSRLSDARTPTTHGSTHGSAGSDPIPAGGLAQSQVANLTSDLAGKVPTTRQVISGTGLSGGGDLTADRTLTVSYGATAGTACEGNDSRLTDARTPTTHGSTHGSAGSDPIPNGALSQAQVANLTTDLAGKVPTARQIISGTGLAGGGDLTADRTLSVVYGVSGGQACEGNDSRLSDARTPTGAAGGDLTGTYPNPTVATHAVTYAKMQPVSTAARLLGRNATTAGNVEEISLGTGLSMSGAVLSASNITTVGVYSTPGTYTVARPIGSMVMFLCVGGGGGGGSGRVDISGNRHGGGGGAGGGVSMIEYRTSDLPVSFTVTVGQGGAGGAGVVATSDGNNGVAGGASTVVSGAINYAVAAGGFAGAAGGSSGGSGAGGAAGTAGVSLFPGGAGGTGGINAPAVVPPSSTGAPGGGGGGGVHGSTAEDGADGARRCSLGLAGTAGGGNGSNVGSIWGSGGGGSHGAIGSSSNGGNGGIGAGGGGSGAATVSSGNGGSGGDGIVFVIGYA